MQNYFINRKLKPICQLLTFIQLLINCTSISAGVVINEIMVNPQTGGEWVELYNPDSVLYNLKKWQISDGEENCLLSFTESIVISPHGFLVIAQDSVGVRASFPFIGSQVLDPPNWPSLNNEGDRVLLLDSLGFTKDSVFYEPVAWFGESLLKGVSIERSSAAESSNSSSNWKFSQNANGGTPGFVNSVYGFVQTTRLLVQAGPKLFHPEKGEVFSIHIEMPEAGELLAEIYNLQGKKEKVLFSGNTFGSKKLFWDGKNNSNQFVRKGPYILFVQFDLEGEKQEHKQSLVVAP
jgi:hypothetical protein